MSELQSELSFDGVTGQNRAEQLAWLANTIADIADEDERVVAGAADLKLTTQLSKFEERHPDRFYQFGISERNMIGNAAGMAACGLRPYVGTMASFAGILALENIKTDLAYPRMPVRVLGTHTGICTGYFGTSHHATEDLSTTRAVADLLVLAPADGHSAAQLVRQTHELDQPIYIRLGRGRPEDVVHPENAAVEFGKLATVRQGRDVAIFATGEMVAASLHAADTLESEGLESTVVDVHTIKPFDVLGAVEIGEAHSAVITVEDHNTEGGLGSIVRDALASRGCRTPVYKHGLRDEFAITGPPAHLYTYYGLDARGIATVSERVLELATAGTFFNREKRTIWGTADREKAMSSVRAESSRAKMHVS